MRSLILLILVYLGLAASGNRLPAQQPAPAAPCAGGPGGMAPGGMMPGGMMPGGMAPGGMGMMGGGGAMGPMMQRHQAMMDSMDARLDKLVLKMNGTKGSSKVDATAAVLNEMVTQRKAMRTMMQQMQQQRMGSPCPATPANPDSDEHAQHHQ